MLDANQSFLDTRKVVGVSGNDECVGIWERKGGEGGTGVALFKLALTLSEFIVN